MSNSQLGSGIAGTQVSILDRSVTIAAGTKGIAAIIGITERGEVAGKQLVRSWAEFVKYFGGLVPYSQFPLYCMRALSYGTPLLVSRTAHYTDVTDKSTVVGTKALCVLSYGGWGVQFEAADIGSWGNNLTVSITDSLGGGGYKDIAVVLNGGSDYDYVVTKVYGTLTTQIMDDFNTRSRLVKMTSFYNSLGNVGGAVFATGTDNYSALDYNDFAGDAAAMTGLHAFDDSLIHTRVAIFEPTTDIVECSDVLIQYAIDNNIMGYFPTPINQNGWSDIDFRNRTGVWSSAVAAPDTYNARFISGTLIVKDPLTGLDTQIAAVADWIGLAGAKDNAYFPWYSESGSKRGRITGTSGVAYNLGIPARKLEADAAADSRINLTISHPQFGIVAWGNETLQVADTMLKFANVAELILYLRRNMKYICDTAVFDPNDPETWKTIYRQVRDFMEYVAAHRGVQGGEGKGWIYEGDQTVDNVIDAVVNDLISVDSGIYKFNLYVAPVTALKFIGVQVVVTNTGATVSLV